MNEELAVRYVYLYKKRNKYLTKAMEEFIRVAMSATRRSRRYGSNGRKRIRRRKGSDKKGDK